MDRSVCHVDDTTGIYIETVVMTHSNVYDSRWLAAFRGFRYPNHFMPGIPVSRV